MLPKFILITRLLFLFDFASRQQPSTTTSGSIDSTQVITPFSQTTNDNLDQSIFLKSKVLSLIITL
jgi:hypothetical protein